MGKNKSDIMWLGNGVCVPSVGAAGEGGVWGDRKFQIDINVVTEGCCEVPAPVD